METDLEKLIKELEFDNSKKETIINVYKSWKTCHNNQVMVSHIKHGNITVNDSIYIDTVEGTTETFKDISNKSTLFFSNCENVNILLCNKINHVIIENSKHINIECISGIIGGIDILHSNNISIIVINQDIYYMGFGHADTCDTYIDKSLTLNTLISTIHCNYINFVHLVNEMLENIKYVTNTSVFGGLYIMFFEKNELHYIYKDGNNRHVTGIIYPVPRL